MRYRKWKQSSIHPGEVPQLPGSLVRYKVRRLEIRSENAAKPLAQAAHPLIRWLKNMASVHAALDFGCGKLRYSGLLARKCQELTLVDSKVQISRTQRIDGKETTVAQYAEKHWPTCRVLNLEEFQREKMQYDFILCANVLSAIPDRCVRSKALLKLASVMRNQGRCLFITQYRNSCFTELADSRNATPHLDGWILKTQRGAFYYGVLDKDKLSALVAQHSFTIEKAWIEGESAYVLTGARTDLRSRRVNQKRRMR
jgi:SAM-dependent methyltransferase